MLVFHSCKLIIGTSCTSCDHCERSMIVSHSITVVTVVTMIAMTTVTIVATIRHDQQLWCQVGRISMNPSVELRVGCYPYDSPIGHQLLMFLIVGDQPFVSRCFAVMSYQELLVVRVLVLLLSKHRSCFLLVASRAISSLAAILVASCY